MQVLHEGNNIHTTFFKNCGTRQVNFRHNEIANLGCDGRRGSRQKASLDPISYWTQAQVYTGRLNLGLFYFRVSKYMPMSNELADFLRWQYASRKTLNILYKVWEEALF